MTTNRKQIVDVATAPSTLRSTGSLVAGRTDHPVRDGQEAWRSREQGAVARNANVGNSLGGKAWKKPGHPLPG